MADRNDLAKALEFLLPKDSFKIEPEQLVLVHGSKTKSIPGDALDSLLTSAAPSALKEGVLANPSSYEVAVRPADSRRNPLLARQLLEAADAETGLAFRYGDATDAYWINWILFHEQPQQGLAGWRLMNVMEEDGDAGGISLLRRILGQPSTIRIEHGAGWSRKELEQLRDAWIFHLAYNLDLVLLTEGVRGGEKRAPGARRARPKDIDAPKRIYDSELVYYYQTALATPGLQFRYLSFYHVIEHYFERVFVSDLVSTVRSEITAPSFSIRRDRDLEKLVKKLSRLVSSREEGIAFEEKAALKLTLERIVKPEALRTAAATLAPEVVSHFKENEVEFCGGDRVDLLGEDSQLLVSGVANRIYKTRNAIVHSKEGDKGKFTPFKHDAILEREMPLIRLVAEAVIVGRSLIIDPPEENK